MPLEQSVRDRIFSLWQESHSLSVPNSNGQTTDPVRSAQCEGWITAAHNAVLLICPTLPSAYRQKADSIASRNRGYMIHEGVAALSAVLINLLRDVDAGAIASIADTARAETFDDFLDHATAYLQEGRKNEAGAIAGIVFEDALRRVCRKHTITEKGIKLDLLISELTNIGILTQAKAKRARAAAHVRTKASHAQWDEFDAGDVDSTIEFTHEITATHLAA